VITTFSTHCAIWEINVFARVYQGLTETLDGANDDTTIEEQAYNYSGDYNDDIAVPLDV